MMAQCAARAVWAGVDTHRDQHVAAVVDQLGRCLGTASFAASDQGYVELWCWLTEHGSVQQVGIEGTGAYGRGLERYLHGQGVVTVEIDRPDRKRRRQHGKEDTVDAVSAAQACLRGGRLVTPKRREHVVGAIASLRVARKSAVTHRAKVMCQIKALLVTAPEALRAPLRKLDNTRLINACASLRPARHRIADHAHATRYALRTLARRYQDLSNEIKDLDELLAHLVHQANPRLTEQFGVGVEVAGELLVAVGENPNRMHSEGAFAMLCGAAPLPASSGQTHRHRLNRGGHRQANRALHTVAMIRMQRDQRTRAYVDRRTKEGLSKRDIMRCLKRYIAREMYHLLTT